jgi:hypothetical protein
VMQGEHGKPSEPGKTPPSYARLTRVSTYLRNDLEGRSPSGSENDPLIHEEAGVAEE